MLKATPLALIERNTFKDVADECISALEFLSKTLQNDEIAGVMLTRPGSFSVQSAFFPTAETYSNMSTADTPGFLNEEQFDDAYDWGSNRSNWSLAGLGGEKRRQSKAIQPRSHISQ